MQIEEECQPTIHAGNSKNSPIHLLHVDDDSSLLNISKLILLDIDTNFEIDHACSVDDALCKLASGRYDVVVSDYEMPQKDGLQFLKILREKNNEIPFILFTGKGREEVAIQALNLGAEGYHNKQGSPETVYGELAHSIRQCAEHHKAKQKLIKSETKYSYLFSNMLNGFAHCKMIFDKENKPVDFVYTEVNDAFTKLTGLKKEAVIGKKATEAIPGIEKTNPEIFEIYGRVALTGKEEQFEIFFNPIKTWLSVTAYCPEKGYFIALFDNITERKNAEENLLKTLEVVERASESIDAGLAVIGKDYGVVWANKRLMDLGVLPNKKCYQTFTHSETICEDCGVKKVFEQNVPLDVHEFKTANSKGETIWIELRVTPLKDKNGEITAALELAVPINKRKEAEDFLKSSQEQLKAIVLNAPIGIATSGSNSMFQSANNAFCKILGYSEDELRKLTFRDITFIEDVADSNRGMAKLISGETSLFSQEKRYIRKDGTIIDGKVIVSAIRDKKGKPILFIAELEDITEHKQAKMELEESEERYRSLFEQAPLPVAITAIDGTIFDANIAFQTLTGHSFEELKKISVEHLYQSKQDRKKLLEILECEGVISDFSTQLKDKNNNIIDAVLNVSKFQIGKESFLRTTIQDVSDRLKSEETMNQIMDQLVLVNEKLGVVGSLTRHDVRNKLSAVNGYAYLLKKKYADQPDIVDGLSKIEQAVKDSTKIFDFAKMYEQLGSEELVFTDVESKLNVAITLFSGELPKIDSECHGLSILADSFLTQLFYNFIDNTRKYGKKTSAIRIHYKKTNAGDLQLIYEDDGVGICAENKPKLFSEGFSTGGSTGYGLFLIRKMMDVYGWSIQETGEPGIGAKFIITIPEKNKFGKANSQVQGQVEVSSNTT